MRRIKYLFAIIFSVLLLEAGCSKKPSARRAAIVPIAQNIPDYAKVQLVSSDNSSQTLKFKGQIGKYVFSPDGNMLIVDTDSGDLPEMKKLPEAKRINDVLQFWDLKNHKLIKHQDFTDQRIKCNSHDLT